MTSTRCTIIEMEATSVIGLPTASWFSTRNPEDTVCLKKVNGQRSWQGKRLAA
jgi:hypothetical protein